MAISTQDYEYFIQKDLNQYAGEWVAILNKQIIAHAKDLDKTMQQSKEKYPSANPLLVKVPLKEMLISL